MRSDAAVDQKGQSTTNGSGLFPILRTGTILGALKEGGELLRLYS